MPDTVLLALLPHRDTPAGAVRHVNARAELAQPESLRLWYVLEADSRRVRLPAPGAGRADRLWEHTCFEAFVGRADSPHYLELNFSPSSQWAAYRFESYRRGMVPVALEEPPSLVVRRGAQRLELEAEIQLRGEPAGPGAGAVSAGAGNSSLRIALSAVVEDQDGGLSYWALCHPAGRPDFHHPDSFALALPFPWNTAP